MKKNKKPMDPLTKIKLIYSGELMFFVILFLTLGILKITGVWGGSTARGWVFNILTLAGGTWMMIDFIWACASKKRREKRICFLDKILAVPSGLYLIAFDIYCIIMRSQGTLSADFYRIGVAVLFFYVAANYLFQSIYHYFYPLKSLVDAYYEDLKKAEEEERKEREALVASSKEENDENKSDSVSEDEAKD